MPNPTPIHSPLFDAMQQFRRDIMRKLKVCLPGSIAAVNTDGTVDVNVGVLTTVPQQGMPDGIPATYPKLQSCPLFVLQGGGAGVVLPVKVNDSCLIIFADRALDNWLSTGVASKLSDYRTHDIADGIVFVGINPTIKHLTPAVQGNEAGIGSTTNPAGPKIAYDTLTNLITMQNQTASLADILQSLLVAIEAITVAGIPIDNIPAFTAVATKVTALLY